jgi:hypothetical protein
LQEEDPVAFEKVLAAQSVQFVLEVAPWCGFFFPAAQLLHSSGLVKPVADEYRPSGHPMQALLETAPISAEYNPAGQSIVLLERLWKRKEREAKKTN